MLLTISKKLKKKQKEENEYYAEPMIKYKETDLKKNNFLNRIQKKKKEKEKKACQLTIFFEKISLCQKEYTSTIFFSHSRQSFLLVTIGGIHLLLHYSRVFTRVIVCFYSNVLLKNGIYPAIFWY